LNAERSTVTEKRIKVYTYTRVSTAMQIDGIESDLAAARDKKSVLEADKMTAENIYRVLINFRQIYDIMDKGERKELMEAVNNKVIRR